MVEKEGGWRKCRGSSDGECQDRRKGKVVSLRREPRVQMNLNGRASREIVEPVSRKVRDQLGICTYSSCICVHTLFFRRLCIFFVPIPPTRSLSIRRCIVPSVLPPFRGPEINNGLPPLTQQKKQARTTGAAHQQRFMPGLSLSICQVSLHRRILFASFQTAARLCRLTIQSEEAFPGCQLVFLLLLLSDVKKVAMRSKLMHFSRFTETGSPSILGCFQHVSA